MIASVSYVNHVGKLHHEVQLFIVGVPTNINKEELRNLLICAGYEVGDMGVPWANHEIEICLISAPTPVKRAWRKGNVPTITFSNLQNCKRRKDEKIQHRMEI